MTTAAFLAPCLADARALWLASLVEERGLSPATANAYERDTRQFLAFLAQHLGGAPTLGELGALRPADVRAFLAERRRRGAGPRSLARALAAIRTFLAHLERRHGVNGAAVRAVSAPAKPPSLPRPIEANDARAMVAPDPAPDWVGLRDAAVLSLLYGAGLRIGEALALDVDDVAAPLSRLLVRGKGGRERLVPILPNVDAALQRYRCAAPFELSAGPFFRGEKGGRLSPRIVQRKVALLRGGLGLPCSATPHALRHAFASHILARGGDLRAIQELLGHARLSTTQIYTAVDERHVMAAYREAHPRAARP